MASSTTCTVCLAIGLLAGLARAQGDANGVPSAAVDGRDPAAAGVAADTHERRAALRAALLAQREAASRQDVPRVEGRQLSERERAELRQQVRQQRRPIP